MRTRRLIFLLIVSVHTDAVLEFKEYKEERGYTVTIKCVDQDIPMEKGKDISDIIRNFLIEADKELSLDYEKWNELCCIGNNKRTCF